MLPGSVGGCILIFLMVTKFKVHHLEKLKKILEMITLILFNKLTKFFGAAEFWCKDEDLLSFAAGCGVIALIKLSTIKSAGSSLLHKT